MKKQLRKKSLPQIITVFVNILLFIAVVFLMNFVQGMLKSDSKITMNEVVNQNRDVITSKLNLEMNSVESLARSMSINLKDNEANPDNLLNVLKESVTKEEEDKVFVASLDGTAVFINEEPINVLGRNYFQVSTEGNPNISDKLIARTNGTEVFIISVPLYANDQVVGTLQRFYSIEEMYDLCSLTLFSSKGTMNILNKDGYIMVSSQEDTYHSQKDNYFQLLYAKGNVSEATSFEKNIKQSKSGFMEINVSGEDSFAAYTPIEGVHDWYLVISIAKSAVSPNGNVVIKMFYIILFAIVLVFGISMLYFFYFKNKQQANIERLAFVDDITKGNTYAKFVVDVEDIRKHHPMDEFYLLKFDIDNFKYINNYYSFAVGDKILFEIYHTLEEKLNEGERIARISSDHYIVLLKNNANSERIQGLLSSIENEEGMQLYFSAGVYKLSNQQETMAQMLDKASAAAAGVKGSLVHKIGVYSEEFDKKMFKNEQMRRAVKQAIFDKEIIPFYQPKVDVNTNEIVGAEALARWFKNDGTMVYPDEFIPLCEQSGLIIDLDVLIFEEVLKFQQARLCVGKECVSISVNFSRNHLFDQNFIPKISNLMKKYQVPMHLIEIEITESAFFNNMDVMNQFVSELHKLGFIVSMDDFGSGYSSLNMLKDVEIDVLKIDREFLIGTQNSEKQRIIFAAISKMAKELDIKVVVEGVETIDNIEMMKMYGCSIAQGYYYAKPMKQADFENFLKGE